MTERYLSLPGQAFFGNAASVMHRIRRSRSATALALGASLVASTLASPTKPEPDRPNVLICIADDQSYPHASAYGYEAIQTPAFDRVAELGALFTAAFTPAPQCSPMRAAFLTGRHIWQIEHAGTHGSLFPKKYPTFVDTLKRAGYTIGTTGKPWGPGNWRASGRPRNPAGPAFNDAKNQPPAKSIGSTDYAENFRRFLDRRSPSGPFCFWFGGHEPHRSYEQGIGLKSGMDPRKVEVPPFLPDTPEMRSDILDYCFEIQWFDRHVGLMLDELERRGELQHTLVIVTSDNGMPFPYAKANCTEYGLHMPLAIAWPERIPGRKTLDRLVSLIDVTATIYEAAGVDPPVAYPLAGQSLLTLLRTGRSASGAPSIQAVFAGRERHSSSRYNSLGYPQRCIRTSRFLYVRNFRPERWPAGTPRKYGLGNYPKDEEVLNRQLGPVHNGYADIDDGPAKEEVVSLRDHPRHGALFHLAVDRRPGEQLFDVQLDPGCLRDLAADPEYRNVKAELSHRLLEYLRQTGDPRVVDLDRGDVFETYPRFAGLRWFPIPDWALRHPERVPRQDWLEERRPK